MAEIALYCLCGQQYDPLRFMIQCDCCKDWFHGSCVNVKEYQSADIDKFYCSKCETRTGPTVYKKRLNWHRHDECDPKAHNKPTQAGTPVFIKELKNRKFHNADEVVVRLRGQQLTLPYLHSNGFTVPILVEGKDGLGLDVPQESFTVQDVENYVGSERMIDVIDVTKQSDVRMSLADYVEYYNNPLRPKVFNVISLEFSDTQLSALVEAPYIARKLCWVNNLWPRDWLIPRPEVQKYCLMGVQDSYTDFHIDFGGSSVWYHVLKGEKVFYLIPPTPTNLALYRLWMLNSNQHEIFFGDKVERCYKCVVQQGNTMFVPTGWIHAVWTPKDSLVFGGNFLHSLNIALQLEVYEIEKATESPERFRFPHFETLHWLAAERLVDDLRDMASQGTRCTELLLLGVKTLLNALRDWSQEKENGASRLEAIPERISVSKLLKDLGRELRHIERNANPQPALALVPVPARSASAVSNNKAQRESSKRVRRKPKARADFVDINEALSNFAAEEQRLAGKMVVKGRVPATGHDQYRRSEKETPANTTNANVPLKLLLSKKIDSDAEEHSALVIDEQKKPAKIRVKSEPNRERAPLKIRLSVSGRSELQLAETTEVAANMDVECAGDEDALNAKNGIEDLLRASTLAGSEALEDLDKTGRTSPSTREAIVGMLSMSRGFQSSQEHSQALSGGLHAAAASSATVAQRHRKGRRRLNSSATDDSGLFISKVHQDDEYIYPSLDASDDETNDSAKKKAMRNVKSKRFAGDDSDDESWNPRARVGPVAPKTDRPIREGAKRPAVERVLEAAAQKRAFEPPAKRVYHKRKKSRTLSIGDSSSQPATPTVATSAEAVAGTSVLVIDSPTSASPAVLKKPENKTPPERVNLAKKPKKGMATAKQRLGKILKIHKMGY